MTHKLTISCTKSNLLKIRHFVNAILSEHNVQEIEAHKIVLAIDEVCANLIIHSNHCNPGQDIDVQVDFPQKGEVTFLIKDRGLSFNYQQYQEPCLGDIISSKRKGGVGLILVKRIMDKIEFFHEKNCNICRLTKKIGS